MPRIVPDLLRALAFLGAAVVCALVGNGLARHDRRLPWGGWVPPASSAPVAGTALPAPPGPAPGTVARPGPGTAAPRSAVLVQHTAPTSTAPSLARFAPAPDAVIRDLSPDDAWAAFQLRIPFLDARRSEDYQDGHVADAWNVPIWEADAPARITEFEARTNPGPRAPIVIYCAGGDCEDSRLLARKLVDLGYRNLFIYRDGFPDWVKHGRPQQRGPHP